MSSKGTLVLQRKLSVSIILVCLLLMLSLSTYVVIAKTSVALGSRWNVPSTEQTYDYLIASHITDEASEAGYNAQNLYGSQTTRDNIYAAANGFGDANADDIVFYIGHGGSEYVWNWAGWIWYYEEQWFITDDAGGKVYDKDIFPNSACRNVIFVLLWSCEQGDVIGGTHWSGTPYGMPYAWLHTTSLSSDGYANPDNSGYCFIGFQGAAPFLTNRDPVFTDGSAAYYPLYYFLWEFYYAALRLKRSIRGSLDYAARSTWGLNSFNETVLYRGYDVGRMVVYGDGNLVLP